MKAIIIEDEHSAVLNLAHILTKFDPNIQILETIDSVSDAIDFLKNETQYDVIFMDIHLADGNSFEIFKEIEPVSPIIFTTAYDQYAIQAFKVNSIDYLLKPIREIELQNALNKLKKLHSTSASTFSPEQVRGLLDLLSEKKKAYRQSFLVKKGDTLKPIATNEFAYFYIENGIVRGTTTEQTTYHLDGKLEDLENDLNPKDFFRVNRQYLVCRGAIQKLTIYFNGRLIVNVLPESKDQIIVSKATVPKLKAWLKQQ